MVEDRRHDYLIGESENSEPPSPTLDSLLEEHKRTDFSYWVFDKTMEGSEIGASQQKTEDQEEVILPSIETPISENKAVSVEFVESLIKGSYDDSFSKDETSATGLEEDSQLVEILAQMEFGEQFDSNSVTSQSVNATEQIVSLSEEVSTSIEDPPIEDSEVLAKENEEVITVTPLENVLTEEPRDSGECRDEAEEPESLEKEIVLAPPPVRPTSWRGCCGLFDLLTGSHR
ncbi:uncharacterized protein LOC143860673 [Tasmannia lanceolata]|uniref:uncharacterized protein LOC143860673 n=1 Tax=Tasmannia lanceolata TaxID=3420 RepID=UPI0040637A45